MIDHLHLILLAAFGVVFWRALFGRPPEPRAEEDHPEWMDL